jgi:Methyltransferase FkbM domain
MISRFAQIPHGRPISGIVSCMRANKIFRFVRALLGLRKKWSWGPFVEAYEITKFDYSFGVSWSQSGEDLSILPLLDGIKRGRYLDIGAHHPTRFSVTRHLYQRGWTGVNVDANSDLLDAFRQSRPNDISLNFCVGGESEYQLSVFKETAISTVIPEWDEKFTSEHNVKNSTRLVKGIRLKNLLDEYFPTKGPDFMNLDIEGADFDALISGDFDELPNERKPLWILVESIPPLSYTLNIDTVRFLINSGYEIWLVLPFACLLKQKRD